MIYKIDSNYEGTDFQKLMQLIKQKFVFLYIDGFLYVAIKDINDLNSGLDFLKECFGFDLTCEITKITPDNLKLEAPVIQDWCRTKFIELETRLYESREQARLHTIWNNLNKLENELSQQKGGVVNNGRHSAKRQARRQTKETRHSSSQ